MRIFRDFLYNMSSKKIEKLLFRTAYESDAQKAIEGKLPLSLFYTIQGEKALFKGEIEEAFRFFDKSVELDPYNSEILCRQGISFFEYGNFFKDKQALISAGKKFKKSVEIMPSYFEAWKTWGNTLSMLGSIYGSVDHLVEADEKIERALQLIDGKEAVAVAECYWTRAVLWSHRARKTEEIGDFQKALVAFQKSEDLFSNAAPEEFWIDFGSTCLELAFSINDIRFAIKSFECFKKSITATHHSAESWWLMAKSLYLLYQHTFDENHFVQANHCFSVAHQLQPHNLEWLIGWGSALLDRSSFSKDTKWLQLIIEKCATEEPFRSEQAELIAIWAIASAISGERLEQVELIRKAEEKINRIIDRSEPRQIDLLHAQGRCFLSYANYFQDIDYYYKAIEKFQEVVSIDRTRHQDWFYMAKIYTKIGSIENDLSSLEKAIYFYKKALLIRSTPRYRFEYATALTQLGDLKRDGFLLEAAISQLEKIDFINVDPFYRAKWLCQYGIAIDLLSTLQEESTLCSHALLVFAEVMRIDRKLPHLAYYIARAYTHLGEILGEIEHLYQAIYVYRLAFKEEENETVLIDWGVTLIDIAERIDELETSLFYYRRAEEVLISASLLGSEDAFYPLACLYSLLGMYERAILFLNKSYQAELLPAIGDLLDDEWLEGVRMTSAFHDFLSNIQQN